MWCVHVYVLCHCIGGSVFTHPFCTYTYRVARIPKLHLVASAICLIVNVYFSLSLCTNYIDGIVRAVMHGYLNGREAARTCRITFIEINEDSYLLDR